MPRWLPGVFPRAPLHSICDMPERMRGESPPACALLRRSCGVGCRDMTRDPPPDLGAAGSANVSPDTRRASPPRAGVTGAGGGRVALIADGRRDAGGAVEKAAVSAIVADLLVGGRLPPGPPASDTIARPACQRCQPLILS